MGAPCRPAAGNKTSSFRAFLFFHFILFQWGKKESNIQGGGLQQRTDRLVKARTVYRVFRTVYRVFRTVYRVFRTVDELVLSVAEDQNKSETGTNIQLLLQTQFSDSLLISRSNTFYLKRVLTYRVSILNTWSSLGLLI